MLIIVILYQVIHRLPSEKEESGTKIRTSRNHLAGGDRNFPKGIFQVAGGDRNFPKGIFQVAGGDRDFPKGIFQVAGGDRNFPKGIFQVAGGDRNFPKGIFQVAGGDRDFPKGIFQVAGGVASLSAVRRRSTIQQQGRRAIGEFRAGAPGRRDRRADPSS